MCFGGTQVINTPAQKTELSPAGQAIEEQNLDLITKTNPFLQSLIQKGGSGWTNEAMPDYASTYGSGLNTVLDANKTIANTATGRLDDAFQNNMNFAVNQAMEPALQGLSALGNKGVINSSLGKQWSSETTENMANAAQNAWSTNLGLQNQLATAKQSSAMAPLSYMSGYYDTVTNPYKSMFSMATGQGQAPLQNAFNQYIGQQTALSAPAQTNVVQQPGIGGVFGSVLGGLAGNTGLFGRK